MSRESFGPLVGRTEPMQSLYERLERFAPSRVPVVLIGETGTGKELCAHVLWERSGRRGPFEACNCASIPEGLVESELFGHRKGAFTGAVRDRRGVVAAADGGTLFLDEIAELAPDVQSKLLRVLESGRYRPVGGVETRTSTFRLVSATHEEIAELVSQHRFREDLFYRLGAVRIRVPPLRERKADVPLLARHFLEAYREAQDGRGPDRFSERALEALGMPSWPGNVRQLRNVVEAAAAEAGSAGIVGAEHVWPYLPEDRAGPAREADSLPTLEEAVRLAERSAVLAALRRTGGNREEAARLLGVSESTLYRKLGALRRREDAT